MVELLEIKMNREGRILLPESISLQSDEVNICISEMQLKTITDKTAQCMFCGSEHNILHIHGKLICNVCREAILHDEYVDYSVEVIEKVKVKYEHELMLPKEMLQIYKLSENTMVLLIIDSKAGEISIIPAVSGEMNHCTICGEDKNLYKLGGEYFCYDCLCSLQKAAL